LVCKAVHVVFREVFKQKFAYFKLNRSSAVEFDIAQQVHR